MRSVRIEVRSRDIARGRRYDPCRCPIAIAVRRALDLDREAFVSVEVGRRRIILESTDCSFPDDARDWAGQFDDGQPVAPFAFSLDLP